MSIWRIEMKPKVIIGLAIGVFLIVIFFQNTQVVSFKILFWEMMMSRIILFLLILLTGFTAGFFVGRKFKKF